MSMAIQTIMLMATSFGIKEVQLTTKELIIATLLVQIVAIPGAFFVAWLSGRIGNIRALGACILAWRCVRVFLLVCHHQRRILRCGRRHWFYDGWHAIIESLDIQQVASSN